MAGFPSQIETHPKRNDIERDIAIGAGSHREIAERYGISKDVVWRHSSRLKNDEPERIRELVQAEQQRRLTADFAEHKTQVMDVAGAFNKLAERVGKIIDKAEEAEEAGLELAAANSLRRVLRDIATLQGKMAQTFNVNVAIADQRNGSNCAIFLPSRSTRIPRPSKPFCST